MKTKKLILPAILGAVAISGAYTFASDSTSTQPEQRMEMGSGQRMGGGMFMGYQEYLDTDALTGDTKTAFDAIVAEYKEKMKTLMDESKDSTGDSSTMQESMSTIWKEFMTSIRPYVSSDKLTEFDAFVAKGLQTPTMGTGDNQRPEGMTGDRQNFRDMSGSVDMSGNVQNFRGRRGNQDGLQNSGLVSTVQYKYITGNFYTKIKGKIEALSDDQLETLLSKIESTIINYQNGSLSDSAKNKAIQIYSELKQMINDQLGVSSEDDAAAQISELFN